MRLDFKENLVFPFSDPEWVKKVALTSLAYITVIPAPAIFGYQLAVIRETANGEDEKLPEFGPGFMSMWVKGIIWCLLLGVVATVPIGATVALMFGVGSAAGNNDTAALGMVAIFMLLMFGILIFISVVAPALMLRYAMTGSASSVFGISAAMQDIRQGPGDYAMIVIFPILGSLAISALGATVVGAILIIPLTVLMMIVQARMLGNYYRAYFY